MYSLDLRANWLMFFLSVKHSILNTVTMHANKWLACVLAVWAGDLAKAALDLSDLWNTSTFHRFW